MNSQPRAGTPVAASGMLLLGLSTPGQAAIDRDVVRNLKASTTYVVVSAGREIQSGSGFLVHVDGQRGIVVTNAHVVRDVGEAARAKVVFDSGTRRARAPGAGGRAERTGRPGLSQGPGPGPSRGTGAAGLGRLVRDPGTAHRRLSVR